MSVICFRCCRKGMSSSTKRGAAPTAPGVGLKVPPPGVTSNGSGPPQNLSYQGEPVDDVNMNEVIEENLELNVTLPSGKTIQTVVDHSMPMLDLIIQLAAKNKINPSGYTLVVISEETGRPIDYKANQTVASVGSQTFRLVPKKVEKEKLSGKSMKGKSQQPFEMTHRFTVNLPRNQKMVVRISPAQPLDQFFYKVCDDKNLNPAHYQFQHPKVNVDMKNMTIGDLKSNEVNLVSIAMMDSARSMPDLSTESGHAPTYMPGVAEPKKKRGFLSFLKKDKKFKLSDTNYQLESPSKAPTASTSTQKPLTPPTERRQTDTQTARPKSMFASSKPSELSVKMENGHMEPLKENISTNTLPKAPLRTGKKRPAPLPPSVKTGEGSSKQTPENPTNRHTIHVVVNEQKPETVNKTTDTKGGPDSVNQRLHSRNSSDSSGYHELTLSGAESPEAGRVKSTFQTSIDTTSIESAENTNDSQSSHNSSAVKNMAAGDSQTLPLNRGISKPPRQRSHSLERKESLNTTPVKPSTKKKRAPAPPQPGAVSATPQLPTHEENVTPPEQTDAVDSFNEQVEEPSSEETVTVSGEQTSSLSSDLHVEYNVRGENDHATSSINDEVDFVTVGEKLEDEVEEEEVPKPDISALKIAASAHPESSMEEEEEGQMMERASLCSEDIDNILVVNPKSRPCSFIAPPPPLEPPPDKEYVDVGVVVNEDNASLAPHSLKGSPTSIHSRMSSRSSIGSVNTIEDVSLDFEQTIAMGEEYLQADGFKENEGYKTEMARFVQQMTNLTVGSDQEKGELSDSATVSVQDTEESDTGSVIHHSSEPSDSIPPAEQTDTDSYTESEISTQSDLERREKERQARLSAIFNNNQYNEWEEENSPRFSVDSKSIGRAINEKLLSPKDDLVSELTYDIPSLDLPPPPEFQNEPQESVDSQIKEAEPEAEEEEWTTVEEVYHIGPASTYTFGGSYHKIPDLETRKEPDSPKSRSTKSLSTFTYYKEPEDTPEEPKEKEEFVLTTSDLANVNFIASPPMKNRLSKSVSNSSRPGSNVQSKYTEQKFSEPSYGITYGVKSRLSDIYGSKTIEVEEKPVSKINSSPQSESYVEQTTYTSTNNASGPRRLTPSGWTDDSAEASYSSSSDYTSTPVSNVGDNPNSPKYEINNTTYSRLLTPSGWQSADSSLKTLEAPSTPSPPATPPVNTSMDESKLAQYEQLQQQFKQWQDQLELNQNMLANQQLSPENQAIQTQMRMQIEMQKEMMAQLQKSMLALTQESPSSKNTVSPVAAPPPPPELKTTTKTVNKTTSSTPKKYDKRFERQLDPREELMIAIRSFGGRNGLQTSPVKQNSWSMGSR